ncbi:hypothetical protein LCGC14_2218850, partial [marine sediment metagenome]
MRIGLMSIGLSLLIIFIIMINTGNVGEE